MVTEDWQHTFFAFCGCGCGISAGVTGIDAAFDAVPKHPRFSAGRFDFTKVETILPVGGQNRDLVNARHVR